MCSPVITVLFADPMMILLIVYAGTAITILGMTLGWSASGKQ
jgi:hypothetical protein